MTNPGINVILKTTRTLGKPKCVNMFSRRVNFTCCGHAPAVFDAIFKASVHNIGYINITMIFLKCNNDKDMYVIVAACKLYYGLVISYFHLSM